MTNIKISTQWNMTSKILSTQLSGPVTVKDIEAWIQGLEAEVKRIPSQSRFKLLLDLFGFEPIDIPTHKAMRLVIPNLLVRHGMRPAFIDLFDDKPAVQVSEERGIRCVAFANVHHDPDKMKNYENKIAKPDQKFFTNREEAENWLKSIL